MSDEETEISADIVRALEGILLVAMEPVDPTLLAQLLELPLAVVEAWAISFCHELIRARVAMRPNCRAWKTCTVAEVG